jgi:LL-diaminopimelate aminotransferase
MQRNERFAGLKAGYLFPEVSRRRALFQASHPDAKLISLGVGNTTEPITPHICGGLVAGAERLGTMEGYTGYGDEQGLLALRERIAEVAYEGKIAADEVFVSDGAKCDIGRLQILFGACKAVVQDPAYPVYVDGSIIQGAEVSYMPCTRDNGFMPDVSLIPESSVVYFCSPNNPTGAVATKEQLALLVAEALRKRAIIVFDAAYSEYISDPKLPKTIYEIEGAKQCAIEVNSFSKPIGFTGVRLGWSIIPKELKYSVGGSVHADWLRIATTIFNGASNIAQAGGLAYFDPKGREEMWALVAYYMENAGIIKAALTGMGIECIGGDNAPYIWAHFPDRDSWEVFGEILEKCHVVTTPGSGFGPSGQSYIRFSAFGHRQNVQEAVERLKKDGSLRVSRSA